MPGGDRTGPFGLGPGTGRAAGFCAGYGVPGYVNPVFGGGFMNRGRGRGGGFGGGGRGWRNRFYATGLTGRQRAATGWPVWGGAVPCTYPAAGPPMTGEQELEVLKNKAAYFEDALKEIQKQIEELQSRNKHD
ncbi:MAG TPA: DUF5320 domain-containing protein [Deltaproteobacteria bacterium]|nr:DUF5320 domain-containing protein [Deltaproteobacteria bacterium]HQO81513.1 DUF5320 domain-containing protein [Deltaproteobacteria bacterium]HQQ16355.1 DUF5320 domain-containing protein [Deltaproteobacteria bacterium]